MVVKRVGFLAAFCEHSQHTMNLARRFSGLREAYLERNSNYRTITRAPASSLRILPGLAGHHAPSCTEELC